MPFVQLFIPNSYLQGISSDLSEKIVSLVCHHFLVSRSVVTLCVLRCVTYPERMVVSIRAKRKSDRTPAVMSTFCNKLKSVLSDTGYKNAKIRIEFFDSDMLYTPSHVSTSSIEPSLSTQRMEPPSNQHLRVTVCEIRTDTVELISEDFNALVLHAKKEKPDVIVLPEMTFSPWVAAADVCDPSLWQKAIATHQQFINKLKELHPAVICSTRPVTHSDGRRFNVGYINDPINGVVDVHYKYYLPNEEGYYESRWYDRGSGDFIPIKLNCKNNKKPLVGFQICTEIWFPWHGRKYGEDGVQLIVCPRACPKYSLSKWETGGKSAAVISGCFVASSNHITKDLHGGGGWIASPTKGDIIARTTPKTPFVTVDIDLKEADQAKLTYPRYVKSKF